VAARSHPGLRRPNIEDHFLVARLGRTFSVLATNLTEGSVPSSYEEAGYAIAVADGMGGAEAGEVASALALSLGTRLALREPTWHLRLDEAQAQRLVERVDGYFRRIHEAVTAEARTGQGRTGMGTTLTVAYSVGYDLFVFHVGDSRAYLLRDGITRQLTRDQTMAQELADSGAIPHEAVGTHHLRHVLTHAIGAAAAKVTAAIYEGELMPGDRLLLCTDGLSDLVDDRTLGEVLGGATTAEAACDQLIDLALARGGHDNVTAAAAFYTAQ
jgi:protein phosphatase